METRIATHIETKLFYSIIKYLSKRNWYFSKPKWKITIEYSPKIFDKGMDFDFYQLENNEENILFVWTNWFGGELKATTKNIEIIEKKFGVSFEFGAPEFLHNTNIIEDMKELLDFKK